MANGCVCCKVRDDLVGGLLQLADMELHGILVETSGLAEVLPVCQTFFDPRIQEKITLDAVIAVIDAGASLEGAAEDIRLEQLIMSDAVLLNKVDRLEGAERKEKVTAIQAIAPHATVIPCRQGRVNLDQVLNLDSFSLSSDWFSRQPSHLHHAFQSQSLACDEPLDIDALRDFLQKVIEKKNVIRCKGVLMMKSPTGETSTVVVQGVGGHVEMEPVIMDAQESKLVLIGPNFKMSPEVENDFAQCTASIQAKLRQEKTPAEKMLAAL